MGASLGKSKSRQGSQQESFVDPIQQQYLASLYGTGAQKLAEGGSEFGEQFMAPAFEAWRGMLNPGQNPQLQATVREAQRLAGEGFNENILPGIRGAAGEAGAYGGARHGIAEGIAGRDAYRGQERIATDLLGADYEQGQGRILQALGLSGGLAGLGASSWAPLLAYAQLLGRPTVLSEGSSFGKSSAWNVGVGATAGSGASGIAS